ncbi:MAG: FHA domain-containing protein [Planctomycetes bacterium]|nr:FHA domain-containing protein [Planctomycetota bacterium]
MGEVLSIRLTGIAGYSSGREFTIEEGGEAVIGRSREASFRVGEEPEPGEDKEKSARPFKGSGGKDQHLLTVSGKHVKIEFEGSKCIWIEDLSKHGTFLNGNRIKGRDRILDLGKAPLELRLGTNETFRMELVRTPAKEPPRITVKRRGS